MSKKELTQLRLDRGLLQIAIEHRHLPRDSSVEDLTEKVRFKMMDRYVLRDAISLGYLPRSAEIRSLTLRIRDRMYRDGKLVNYSPDGKICHMIPGMPLRN